VTNVHLPLMRHLRPISLSNAIEKGSLFWVGILSRSTRSLTYGSGAIYRWHTVMTDDPRPSHFTSWFTAPGFPSQKCLV
jgi:hypothetical protein